MSISSNRWLGIASVNFAKACKADDRALISRIFIGNILNNQTKRWEVWKVAMIIILKILEIKVGF